MTEGKKFVLKAEGRPNGAHQGTYNLPVADEVALVTLNDSLEPADIQIYLHNGEVQRINHLNAEYDPLHYTILFPYGNSSWHTKISHQKDNPINYSLIDYFDFFFIFIAREKQQKCPRLLSSSAVCCVCGLTFLLVATVWVGEEW